MRGRLRVKGPRPRTPFLLVSNDLSFIHVPALAACIDAWFVPKFEIRAWPLAGMLAIEVKGGST